MSDHETQPLIDLIISTLDDDKAQDLITIDLTYKSSIADAMVVASGQSNRHVSAMAGHLREILKTNGFGNPRIEGLENSDWVLLDTGDVIVHLFRPEVRAYYNIEKMWSVTMPEPAAKRP